MSSNATVLADLPAWQQFPVGLTAVGAVAFALFTLWVFPALLPAKEGDIHTLGGLSILTAWPFFSKRYDFLRANFQKTGQDLFKFHILQVRRPLCPSPVSVDEHGYSPKALRCCCPR